jgi:hypothetical protein
MAVIHAPTSPVARCSICGVQRQFHSASEVPHSADRDHAFAAETVADFEPSDLGPGQLVAEIFAQPNSPRAVACGHELRVRLLTDFGASWEDLQEALA